MEAGVGPKVPVLEGTGVELAKTGDLVTSASGGFSITGGCGAGEIIEQDVLKITILTKTRKAINRRMRASGFLEVRPQQYWILYIHKSPCQPRRTGINDILRMNELQMRTVNRWERIFMWYLDTLE